MIDQAMLDKVGQHNLRCHHRLTMDRQSVIDTFGRGVRLRCIAGHGIWIRQTETPRARGCYADLPGDRGLPEESEETVTA